MGLEVNPILVGLVAFVALLLGVAIHKIIIGKRLGSAKDLASRIVEEARKEAQAQKKEIILQGQDELFRLKKEKDAGILL